MFILEKPYVSSFLVDTIVQNDWAVLENDVVEEADIEEDAFNLWTSDEAKQYYLKQEFPLICSNSEHGINWVLENLPQSNLASYIKLFKNKGEFRELLRDMYPTFYYKVVGYDDLKNLDTQEIKFPVILKPAVGFLSLGVHVINDKEDWNDALGHLSGEMKYAKSIYPSDVINSADFIIEEMVEGEEYAIDAYYNRNGDAIILNILEHPLSNEKDVRDRIYVTSTEIMVKYIAKFAQLLRDIGELRDIRNFPVHVEVRVTKEGNIIPIEINPMRFAGWCTADIAEYAWGINVYEYFHNHIRPDWNEILSNAGKETYYFSMIEVPEKYAGQKDIGFDYNSLLSNFSKVLEVRRINPDQNPLFCVVFGSTPETAEVNTILSLDIEKYIIA